MSLGILGLASAYPEQVMTNKDIEKIVDTTDEWIVSRTGIKERRLAAPEQTCAEFCEKALRAALDLSGTSATELGALLVSTCTPDLVFPSTACLVQGKIENNDCVCMDLQAACTGFIYGLVTAQGFFKPGQNKKIAVIGADLLSRHVDWDDRTTCILFGDGAGAVVLGEVPDGYGILGSDIGSDGHLADVLYVSSGNGRNPLEAGSGDGKTSSVKMRGREVFKLAVQNMGRSMRRAIEAAGISQDEIDLFVPHQANVRIINTLAKFFNIPSEKVYITVDRFGNTSAASIPMALTEAYRAGKLKRGTVVAMTAFGAGLTWGSVILRWY